MQINMGAPGDNGVLKQKTGGDLYQEALVALSSLITKRDKGEQFKFVFDYLKILDLEQGISKMKVIHVAGTKGKGSTCSFTESILRNYGFRTGLLTSPHLIDVRERFRLNGIDISEEKFVAYFWWCYNKLKEETNEETTMPSYFRFLTLLGLKIFAAEEVDVVILEVGLGGRIDVTNVVQKPVVCGISSLGYDHMEILGDTLGKIAGEKAGIFKLGVPAFTVPQPDEAMRVLEQKASELDVNLKLVQPLNKKLLSGHKLGLDGDHQYLNAALAVSLAYNWLHQISNLKIPNLNQMTTLPEQFIKGLATVSLQGRAQVVPDQSTQGKLVFYLDGAHSPESMEACAKWFSLSVTENGKSNNISRFPSDCEETKDETLSGKSCQQILLFNCMSARDPKVLLPTLRKTCAKYGVDFKKALFVPNSFHKVGTNTLVDNNESFIDLLWQHRLQQVWETSKLEEDGTGENVATNSGQVFCSLVQAINWVRESVVDQDSSSTRIQVLVTGSVQLVGDVLRLIGN